VNPVTTLFSAAVLSCLMATGASGQTPEAAALSDVGRALVASNNLKLSADTERSVTSTSPVLVKQFVLRYSGVVRLSFELKNSPGSPFGFVNAAVTTQVDNLCFKSTSSTAFVSFTCDIRVVAGDSMEVRVSGTFDIISLTTPTTTIRNVQVLYNVVNSSGVGKTLLN
jgi:hypothetical protein